MDKTRNLQNNWVACTIIFFVVVIAFSLTLAISLKRTSGDFDVYYKASQNYLAKAPVYTRHAGIEEFKYLPLFALVFSPLTTIEKLPALYIWSAINIFSFYFIFYFFYKLKLFSLTHVKDLILLILLFMLTGRFIFANIKIGQVNILLCLLMVLTMYFEINKKYFWAAVVLAFSLMIKFFPLLFLFYFLLRRRFKIVVYTVLMVIVFLFLPGIYSGFDVNWKYLQEWFSLIKSTPAVLLYSVKNYSLLSFYSWFFVARHDIYYIFDYACITKGLIPEVYWAWAASCGVFFSAFFYDTFFVKNKDPQITYLDYSCLFVCGLLFNPLAYLNALVFLIIPYFFILRLLLFSRPWKTSLGIMGVNALFCFILSLGDNGIFFKNKYQFYIFLECRPFMWVIILVYLNLWLAKHDIFSRDCLKNC